MNVRRGFALFSCMLLIAGMATSGCTTIVPADSAMAANLPPPGLTIEELQAMLSAHRPQPEIVQEIRNRGLRAPPTQDDINSLGQNGATNDVLDAVAQASIETPVVGMAPLYAQPSPWWPWFGLGLGWGGGYYGGGFHRVPGGVRPGTGSSLGPRPPGHFRGPSMPSRGGGRHR
jgi:hypothetical protein